MNTPQQIAAVKAIIKIKNKILQTADWDQIADLIQHAIDIASPVPPNIALDSLDRTRSKGWNIIATKRLLRTVKERTFAHPENIYSDVSAGLLRLSMVFVEGELEDLNKILADAFLKRTAPDEEHARKKKA